VIGALSPNTPRQKLRFIATEDVNDSVRTSIRQFVRKLGESRSWLVGPPQVIDAVDDLEDNESDPIQRVGGELEIFSALRPLELPRDVDKQHLEEVTALVEAVKKFSQEAKLAFDFELDRTFVGTIEDGSPDRTLQVGLLDEWRKQLESN